MLFGNKLRELREKNGLVLRKVAAILDIDTATLSKIELGARQAKREYLPILSELYKVEIKELEKLWLTDKVYEIIEYEEQGLNVLKEAANAYKKTQKVH
ncbi:helix-turn-helix domain-containing protein [Draconibacterium halophilum]|jgi:transcriptional regulator with XRE-family HTH domain|uniref:Helix-turn-helix transcriptional regulator n=1 Tax=Draconibacterium halophilum TaxID=2706887 RepID=A0A6C0RFB8_9BACT|nr:helix-turn-helix transcriptional regulator [Draconibacterium halophilum]QIA08839.1 helix-turn-helix transcriptional regulator [Draconibacterium halophilum]